MNRRCSGSVSTPSSASTSRCNASAPASGVRRDVLDYLSKDDRLQVKIVLRAAWKLPSEEGMARIKKLAAWLDQKHPFAASCLVEGLEECLTINRLDVPPLLCRRLATVWPPPTSPKVRMPPCASRPVA